MPVHRVYAHERVEADRGKVALMRGPLVYCLEAVDHGHKGSRGEADTPCRLRFGLVRRHRHSEPG